MDQESDTEPSISQRVVLIIMAIVMALAVLSTIIEHHKQVDKIDCQNTNIHLDK